MVGLVGRTLCERLFTYPFIHQSINPAFKMVVPAGNAPASSGYQPGALLLSYRTMADGVWMGFPSLTRWMPEVTSFASRIVMHPRSPEAHSVFGTGALLLCQPSAMVRVAFECRLMNAKRRMHGAQRHWALPAILHSAFCALYLKWLPGLGSHQHRAV